MSAKYSIDTSAVLDGRVRYYPPDVFPSMWERIEGLANSGVLIATEEVLFELQKKDDDVFKWAKKLSMFISLDNPIQAVVSDILIKYPRLVDTRKSRSSADPFVIGLAAVNNCAVVTAERATGSLEKPNIPDVCLGLGISCMTLLDMFRDLGWRV